MTGTASSPIAPPAAEADPGAGGVGRFRPRRRPDLALCGWATNQPVTLVLRNDGAGVFTDTKTVLPGVSTAPSSGPISAGMVCPTCSWPGWDCRRRWSASCNDGAGPVHQYPRARSRTRGARARRDGFRWRRPRVDSLAVSGVTTNGESVTRLYRNTGEDSCCRKARWDWRRASWAGVISTAMARRTSWLLPVTTSAEWRRPR